ncbi:CHAD domain-containing protein [Aminobacter anthyllidis]|uniref:CHAD domain-containing protein n=1 Tax=Aminobacter anthyllidis TaxID=1035067 RepID=A0A9X1AEG3_9HYPH|nr:CHAD domain-containing protein [Aminobacter anthyllidis]MBT1158273.1 CHAD domain-containing protein [Aminobacter anthyllidis]
MSFRIDPRLALTGEVRRIAGEEIEKIAAHLNTARDNPEKALHNARKRLKALRALLHLVRPGDEAFCRTENDRYRAISASIAGPRQATALIETIDRLAEDFAEEADAAGLAAIRARLVRHRAQAGHGEAGLSVVLDTAIAECQAGFAALQALALPDLPENAADVLADGALATLRRARKALEQSRERGEADDFHDLRKAVKRHAAHLSLLRKLWPSPVKPRRERAEALGESLGELHDVFVMRQLIEAGEAPFDGPEPKHLVKLLKRSEKALRKLCLNDAAELFEDRPRRTARRLAKKARDDLVGSMADTEAD